MPKQIPADFLQELEQQAQKQALIHQRRVLPAQLDWLTSLIGNYPWQTILFLSGFMAILLEILET